MESHQSNSKLPKERFLGRDIKFVTGCTMAAPVVVVVVVVVVLA